MNTVSYELDTGKSETHKNADYYIQDGILTIFRNESICDGRANYYEFEMHIPMNHVVYVICVKN